MQGLRTKPIHKLRNMQRSQGKSVPTGIPVTVQQGPIQGKEGTQTGKGGNRRKRRKDKNLIDIHTGSEKK